MLLLFLNIFLRRRRAARGGGEYRFKWVGCADGFLGSVRFILVVLVASGQIVERDVVVRLRGQLDEVDGAFSLLLAGRDLRLSAFVADGPIQTEPLPQQSVVH